MKDFIEKFSAKLMEKYIEFVYKTSDLRYAGNKEILFNRDAEKVVVLFWHGESYCFYPAFRGIKLYVTVTRDRRGDYIADMCDHFGYHAIRVPDFSEGGSHVFKIRELVKNQDLASIAIALDGPMGPYHIPKDFPFAMAYLLKRRVVPLSIQVKRKITLERWDKFAVPLPFNRIIITIGDPVTVSKEGKADKFAETKSTVKALMEKKTTG